MTLYAELKKSSEQIKMIDKFWQRVKYLQQAYDNSNNDTVKQLYKMKLLDYMLRLEEHEKREVNL